MEISPIEMYNLPSDVYSPRCSPSGSENQNFWHGQAGYALLLGRRRGLFDSTMPDCL